jgi:hypothetical protein
MQICLLPKSKMWVEVDHHSISRLSQEPIPQVFVQKIEASEVEFSPKQPACPNGWINVHIIRLQA